MNLIENKYLRIIYTLTSLFYLVPAYILYTKKYYIGQFLYILCSGCSFIWSLTSYGGVNGILAKTDQVIAISCIIYNINYFFNLQRLDQLQSKSCLILLFIASLIHYLKEFLVTKNTNPIITYGLLRILWRCLSAYGTYLAFKKASKN